MPTITKDLLRVLRPDINAALDAIATKHGVSLKLGNCTFSALNATFKLEVATIGEGGEVIDKTAAFLRSNCAMLGLKDTHLNQVINLGGKSFTLHGYKNTGGAKPFIIKGLDDGKTYIATREQIARALGLDASTVGY